MKMSSPLRKVCLFGAELALRSAQDASVGAIRVSSLREDKGHFACVVRGALDWVSQISPGRYARIQKHLRWICCRSLPLGKWSGEYEPGLRMCSIDFEPLGSDDMDRVFVSLTLIHEATHARLLDFGIPYDAENRLRVEAICRGEERLLACKLSTFASGLPDWLINSEVDADMLKEAWSMSKWQQWMAIQRRMKEHSSAEPYTAPNGGPAAPLDSSGVTKGPPPVS